MVHAGAITLKQLRALVAVLREGTVSAAAAALHVTGPAVSVQLKQLEENLGIALVERGQSGRIGPTEAGREVLAAAAQIENALGRSIKTVEALKTGAAGHVVLGVVSTGKYFAPALVARAGAELPGISIELKVGNRETISAALQARAVDLAIMGRPPRQPDVDADPLGDHPHVMIAPPDHPLARAAGATPEALLRETFLLREPGSGTRILMERYLDALGEGRDYAAIELGTNETIKQAVMAGLGLAILSAHTVTAELQSGRLVTLDLAGLPVVRTWFMVRRADTVLSAAAERTRRFILECRGDYLPPVPASR